MRGELDCPFIYASGQRCRGRIVRIEAYKAELVWSLAEDGRWIFNFSPRSHYHLFCSLKGNHAGSLRPDDPQMKLRDRDLSDELRAILDATIVTPEPPGS